MKDCERLTVVSRNDKMDFLYDANEELLGFKDNGTTYYYRKSLQGDIAGIVDATGTEVVSYTYDAWGKLLSVSGEKAETLG